MGPPWGLSARSHENIWEDRTVRLAFEANGAVAETVEGSVTRTIRYDAGVEVYDSLGQAGSRRLRSR